LFFGALPLGLKRSHAFERTPPHYQRSCSHQIAVDAAPLPMSGGPSFTVRSHALLPIVAAVHRPGLCVLEV